MNRITTGQVIVKYAPVARFADESRNVMNTLKKAGTDEVFIAHHKPAKKLVAVTGDYLVAFRKKVDELIGQYEAQKSLLKAQLADNAQELDNQLKQLNLEFNERKTAILDSFIKPQK